MQFSVFNLMGYRDRGTPTHRIVEDAKGRVLSFRRRQDLGGGPSVTSGRLTADGRLALDIGNHSREIDYPEGALGPAAVARRVHRGSPVGLPRLRCAPSRARSPSWQTI